MPRRIASAERTAVNVISVPAPASARSAAVLVEVSNAAGPVGATLAGLLLRTFVAVAVVLVAAGAFLGGRLVMSLGFPGLFSRFWVGAALLTPAAAMLPPLLSRTDAAYLTRPPTAPEDRQWDPVAAADLVDSITLVRVVPDFVEALDRARTRAGNGTVVVTGSAHSVGPAMTLLGLDPLAGQGRFRA